jgi:hypothetical protein
VIAISNTLTVTFVDAEKEDEPDAPVTVLIVSPLASPLTVRVVVFVPVGFSVRLDGLIVGKTQLQPDGFCVAETVTVPLKLPMLVIVMLEVLVEPAGIESVAGVADIVKPLTNAVTIADCGGRVPLFPVIVML